MLLFGQVALRNHGENTKTHEYKRGGGHVNLSLDLVAFTGQEGGKSTIEIGGSGPTSSLKPP